MTALRDTQPQLADSIGDNAIVADLGWVFGRDGSLTARDADGHWWADCSLAHRAAEAQLEKLDVQGPVGCFIAPPHAAAVRVALDRMRAEQAIIAIIPDLRDLEVLLHCGDFALDVDAHRLWIVSGQTWAEQLTDLLANQIGLSIPTQFIRLNTADPEIVEAIIAPAQKIFSDVTARRAEMIRATRQRWTDLNVARVSCPREVLSTGETPVSREHLPAIPKTAVARRLCVLAPSRFRLWNDWGNALASTFNDANCLRLDTDDPANAAPPAVARAACECDALVTVDLSRADAPGVLPDEMPWITWIINGRIPPQATAGKFDQIVLLDPADRPAALAAGWDTAHVHIARPEQSTVESASSLSTTSPSPAGSFATFTPSATLIADTFDLDPPASIDDYSSHRPLWEYIADELTRNPFAVGDQIDSYLTSRLHKFEIAEQMVNRACFIARLIVPAYQQGLARLLLDAGVSIRLFGNGWETIDRFRASAGGPVLSREAMRDAISGANPLIYAWPTRRVHAIDFAGRPVVRAGRTRETLLRNLRNAVPATATIAESSPIFSAEVVRQIMASTSSTSPLNSSGL